MKHLKKAASLLLALMMIFSLSLTVFAENGDVPAGEGAGSDAPAAGTEEKGSIKITNAIPEETYKLYKLLDLKSYNKVIDPDSKVDVGQYFYTVNPTWAAFFQTAEAKEYFSVDASDGHVTWVKKGQIGSDAVSFAKLALKYATDNNIQPVKEIKIDGKVGDDAASYTFEDLELGYYLLDSSVGSLCTLNTTNPNIEVIDKNAIPTNDKDVQENGKWEDENDAKIGDTVKFRSYITFKSGITNFKFHDKMDDSLTFLSGTVKVELDPEGTKAAEKVTTLQPGVHYNVVTKGSTLQHDVVVDGENAVLNTAETCSFHIEFTDKFYELITTGDHQLSITYSAILNENAVIGGTGNVNASKVSYGDNNHFTKDSETVTKTWEVPVFKYTAEAGTAKGLSDTKFTLSKSEDGSDPIQLVKIENKTVEGQTWAAYRVATDGEIANASVDTITVITTDDTGRFRIIGLDSGTYYLTETEAKDGYNKLDKPVTIVIAKDGTFKKNESTTSANMITVQNNSGSLLPSTGGIGTTIFYVAGSVLLVGAAVLLITKKRMSAES